MQRKAALWILRAFKTSLLFGIKAIAGLIPIKLHLQKLGEKSQPWVYSLPSNYLIWLLLELSLGSSFVQHLSSLNLLASHQHSLIKGHLVDMDNRFNRIFPSFISLHSEFSSSYRVINNFSDCFSFNLFNKHHDNDKKICIQQLDNIVIESSNSPSTAIVVMNTSVKNDITTSISHMHTYNNPITKTLHHIVYITSTEAELFAIRCSINQASNHIDISKIIVVTNSIHIAKNFFDSSSHPFQAHSTAILSELWEFFLWHQSNFIKFWECPSYFNWSLHKIVNKETKAFNSTSLFPCKISWDFGKKSESDDILNTWKMIFQASDLKGKQFLNLLDGDNNIIEPSYIKGGSWLKSFSYSNSLCV